MKITLSTILDKYKRLISTQITLAIGKQSILAFLINTSELLLNTVLQPFITRNIGPAQYGTYVYVLSIINIAVIIGCFGIENTTLKIFPPIYSDKSKLKIFTFLFTTNIISIFSALFISLLALIVFNSIFEFQYHIFKYLPLTISLLIFTNCFILIFRARLRSIKKVAFALAPNAILRPIIFISILLLSWAGFSSEKNAENVLIANSVSALIILIVISMAFKIILRKSIKKIYFKKFDTTIIKISFSMLVVSLVYQLHSNIDIIVAKEFLKLDQVGIYAVCKKLSNLLLFGLFAISMVVAPYISDAYHRKQDKQLYEVLKVSAIICTITTIGLSIILIVFGGSILGMFGPKFCTGYTCLIILVMGQVINSLTGVVGLFIVMIGKQKVVIAVTIMATLISISMCIILTRFWGLEGIAFSNSFSISFLNIALFIYSYKKYKINTSCFGLI